MTAATCSSAILIAAWSVMRINCERPVMGTVAQATALSGAGVDRPSDAASGGGSSNATELAEPSDSSVIGCGPSMTAALLSANPRQASLVVWLGCSRGMQMVHPAHEPVPGACPGV